MGSIQNTVHYCCVSRDNQILYSYNGGDPSTESLAALCLEKTPSSHKWYSETMGKRTFGFLMEDGFVYFAIVDEGLERSCLLKFFEHLRDEFKKAVKRNSRGGFSGIISSVNVQDQFVSIIRRLIASLERVAETNSDLKVNLTCLSSSSPPAESTEQSKAGTSTKAPLLNRSSKQEKKKGKDHVISLRGIELEEHRKSTERGNEIKGSDTPSIASSLQKDYVPRRGRSGSQSIEKKWCRQVQIVLAIDVAICLTLLGIWLAVCQGIECTRS